MLTPFELELHIQQLTERIVGRIMNEFSFLGEPGEYEYSNEYDYPEDLAYKIQKYHNTHSVKIASIMISRCNELLSKYNWFDFIVREIKWRTNIDDVLVPVVKIERR